MTQKKKDPKKVAAGRVGGLTGGKAKSEAKTKAARINGAVGAKAGGQVGGLAKSAAKVRAARMNGVRGGKPKGLPGASEHARKAAAARAANLTPERRREIALKAVAAREAKRKKLSP